MYSDHFKGNDADAAANIILQMLSSIVMIVDGHLDVGRDMIKLMLHSRITNRNV